jgi:4-hydroxy-3-methylbut-2-enyl diphosphate reductase
MRIIRASHLGWCFGVRDAVALVANEARHGHVAVLGELVHNETVNNALRAQGVQLTRNLDEVRADTVIVTAHGLSDTALARVRERVPRVLDATCPLVHRAHRAMRQLVAAGYHPVVIGKRDHVEVRGLTDDLAEFDVVLSEEDVHLMPPRWRYGIVAQTTQPVERVERLVEVIRQRFPESEVRYVDTVCRPTKQRQSDAVVVIGGAKSNNTRELAETCARFCPRVFRAETASDLNPAWFVDSDTVGVTAGTSTPDEVIEAVEQWLWNLAEVKNEIHRAA